MKKVCNPDIDFNFNGLDVNCEYDKYDGEIIACKAQDCEIFFEMLSDYYIGELASAMNKAIEARSNEYELEQRLTALDEERTPV